MTTATEPTLQQALTVARRLSPRDRAQLITVLEQIPDWLRPADLTPRPPLQLGAGERNCRRVQPF